MFLHYEGTSLADLFIKKLRAKNIISGWLFELKWAEFLLKTTHEKNIPADGKINCWRVRPWPRSGGNLKPGCVVMVDLWHAWNRAQQLFDWDSTSFGRVKASMVDCLGWKVFFPFDYGDSKFRLWSALTASLPYFLQVMKPSACHWL